MVSKIGVKAGGHAFSLVSTGFLKSSLVFPGGAENRNLPVDAGDTGLISGSGGSHLPRGN